MKTTNGAYIVDNLGKILIVHPNNHPSYVWSVPKGLFNKGETDSKLAAMRETLEETNLYLSLYKSKYKDLGISKYKHNKKKIHGHLFKIDLALSEMDLDLQCKSTYECSKSGKIFPECDIIKWVDYEFATLNLHYTQRSLLEKIKDLLV